MTATLINIPYSPWSERSRWALQARGVPYTNRRYQPLISELGLRRQLGNWNKKVTVPVLLTDDGAITDSFDIARWANARGDGANLFPSSGEAAIARWNQRSEEALAAGRAISLAQVLANPDALDELTPPPLRALGAVSRAVTQLAVASTLRKYDGHKRSEAEHRATLVDILDAVRTTLGGNPNATLLGTFSYADITIAQVLQFVRPIDHESLRIGDANHAAFTDNELATRYPDLLVWRDRLYATYR